MDAEFNGIGDTEDEYQHEVKVLNERVEAIFAFDASGDRVSREAREFEQGKRIDARAMLMDQFGIDSAFVRVPTLARVLNLAPAGIYAAIRENRFFIPHRMLFSAPAVKLDDLVEWYCAEEDGQRWTAKRKGEVARGDSASGEKFGQSRDATDEAKDSFQVPLTPSGRAHGHPTGPIGAARESVQDWPDDLGETDAERLKRERQAIIREVRAQMSANLR
jgi:hypothetical protein